MVFYMKSKFLSLTVSKLVVGQVTRVKKPPGLRVVLSREEVRALLVRLDWLVANLMYGAGLRLMEAMRLRVKDVDPARREILVRDGKGGKAHVLNRGGHGCSARWTRSARGWAGLIGDTAVVLPGAFWRLDTCWLPATIGDAAGRGVNRESCAANLFARMNRSFLNPA